MTREGKLQEKLAHVRGELRRARARIKELEAEVIAETMTKPHGYEHYTWPMIRAIQASTSKPKE